MYSLRRSSSTAGVPSTSSQEPYLSYAFESPFWGIVLGKASQPLGQMTLSVQFYTTSHLHTKYLNFFVANFDTACHAILDRPTLAKFMVAHYMYLVLKMPMESGILPLRAHITTAYASAEESLALDDELDHSARMEDRLADSKKVPTTGDTHA